MEEELVAVPKLGALPVIVQLDGYFCTCGSLGIIGAYGCLKIRELRLALNGIDKAFKKRCKPKGT